MSTKIQIILVPYDSGHRGLRMGAGPEHFVDNGLVQDLESEGHEVFVETIEAQSSFRAEVQTQFGLYRSLAEHVAEARRLVEETGYGRRRPEVAALEAEVH